MVPDIKKIYFRSAWFLLLENVGMSFLPFSRPFFVLWIYRKCGHIAEQERCWNCFRKVFCSIKGYYFQADIKVSTGTGSFLCCVLFYAPCFQSGKFQLLVRIGIRIILPELTVGCTKNVEFQEKYEYEHWYRYRKDFFCCELKKFNFWGYFQS